MDIKAAINIICAIRQSIMGGLATSIEATSVCGVSNNIIIMMTTTFYFVFPVRLVHLYALVVGFCPPLKEHKIENLDTRVSTDAHILVRSSDLICFMDRGKVEVVYLWV